MILVYHVMRDWLQKAINNGNDPELQNIMANGIEVDLMDCNTVQSQQIKEMHALETIRSRREALEVGSP
jgi:hypothetical protein